MNSKANFKAAALARTLAIGLVAATLIAAPSRPVAAQAVQNASSSIDLSVGRGRLISLPAAMSDVFVADDKVADVQVRSSRQLYVFAKAPGETSIYATDASGRVVFSTVARVGNNIETIDQMLSLAMPEASIAANTMNGFVLLTGTVRSPDDAAEAERLVQAFVGDQTKVLSRLRTATPLQVNLQVRIAEVNRSLVKELSGNLLTRDTDGPLGNGFLGGVFGGRQAGTITTDANGNTIYSITTPPGTRSLAGAGRLFGLDLIASLDIGERSGLVATLAQPNLTAISGETADFLAGGEFPVPIPGNFAGTTIEYRKYGVSLAYTPTVLSNGRISLRVRPEVSELSTEGAIEMQGFQIPALTIRRAETTVELGSGESFMIAGLLNNRSIGAIDKMPGLGDVPLLGTLFKSDSFRRGETELVIVVTPYLVEPVSANDIKLPTDAFRDADDLQRLLLNQTSDGVTGGDRPKPRLDSNVGDADRPRGGGSDASPGFSIK
ncbi:type II and III secretion system protein family protein [Sphingopyxis alaskensis]|jgi:pilus assembly protein CpaC|uniref:Type II and III secretion system protein n=1 Tax=Sphingopyxis alaskensis (strain DSM 13593 / LMG 18877 / RB2256) TaxID=317655 RepID=Q1GU27_SPHAL|nr:type II and III secretion system protein family protein [Sphingopyxis alaskensis]ABF52845.1 type II and III secretion system protein [Sphingopyxis alaskensis RB2256]MCM3419552.1 type II and III secretion system protein family protein [Sphingopyxis alaskensis]